MSQSPKERMQESAEIYLRTLKDSSQHLSKSVKADLEALTKSESSAGRNQIFRQMLDKLDRNVQEHFAHRQVFEKSVLADGDSWQVVNLVYSQGLQEIEKMRSSILAVWMAENQETTLKANAETHKLILDSILPLARNVGDLKEAVNRAVVNDESKSALTTMKKDLIPSLIKTLKSVVVSSETGGSMLSTIYLLAIGACVGTGITLAILLVILFKR